MFTPVVWPKCVKLAPLNVKLLLTDRPPLTLMSGPPRVVAIQSGQNLGGPGGDNTSGGGNPLSELINYARNTNP